MKLPKAKISSRTIIITFVIIMGSVSAYAGISLSQESQAEWIGESGWSDRFKITSNKDLVSYENTNLYLDLSMASSGFWEKVRSDGGDIRVTQGDGTTLVAREVSGFDRSNRKGSLFFNTEGYLSTTENTEWYIYYGNPGATEPNPGDPIGRNNVWDDNYVGVWHLDEDRSDLLETTETESVFISAQMSRVDSGQATWTNGLGGNIHHTSFDDTWEIAMQSAYGIRGPGVDKETVGSWDNPVRAMTGLLVFSAENATGVSRVQSAFSGNDAVDNVSATFSQTPTEGNLLVAISAHRNEGRTPSISGSGWNLDLIGTFHGGHRRGMAVWWKIAGESEPTTIETSWDPACGNSLLIQEFEITGNTSFSFDTSTYNLNYDENAYSLSTLGLVRVNDSTSNNNDGTIVGGVEVTSDSKVGRAKDFNGTDRYIEIPDSPELNPSSAITVSYWFNNPPGERGGHCGKAEDGMMRDILPFKYSRTL